MHNVRRRLPHGRREQPRRTVALHGRQQRAGRSNGNQQSDTDAQQGRRREGGEKDASQTTDASRKPQGQTIWVLTAKDKLEPRFVRTGLSNGRVTEIVAGNLQEGETVVIGKTDSGNTKASQPTASPFGQQPGGRGMGGGRGR